MPHFLCILWEVVETNGAIFRQRRAEHNTKLTYRNFSASLGQSTVYTIQEMMRNCKDGGFYFPVLAQENAH